MNQLHNTRGNNTYNSARDNLLHCDMLYNRQFSISLAEHCDVQRSGCTVLFFFFLLFLFRCLFLLFSWILVVCLINCNGDDDDNDDDDNDDNLAGFLKLILYLPTLHSFVTSRLRCVNACSKTQSLQLPTHSLVFCCGCHLSLPFRRCKTCY